MGWERILTQRMKDITIYWVLPLLAFCIAIQTSFYHLSESPAVWYDEGFFEQLALNVSRGGEQVMTLAPGVYLSSWSISAGYPLIYPMAASFAFFGPSVFSARIVPVTYLILFVIAAYLYVRRQYGATAAGISALLLATFPLLYGNGKSVLGEVPALFWFTVGLLALYALERGGYQNRTIAFLAGLGLGLALAAKFTFMLIVPAILAVALFRVRSLIRAVPFSSLAAGVVGFMLPVALWLFLQFGSGDSIETTLTFFINPYAYESQALGASILQNLTRFFTETTPLYLTALFGTWTVALIMRRREHIPIAELLAFTFSLLVLVAYLRTPGWYRYFFPAMTITMLFAPYAATIILSRISAYLPPIRTFTRPVLYVGFGILIIGQAYQLMHGSYVASYYGSTRTAELRSYFAELDPTETVFLYNVPEIAIFLPQRTFYQYLNPHTNQGFGAEALPLLKEGKPDIVVVNAETHALEIDRFGAYDVHDRISHYLVLTRRP